MLRNITNIYVKDQQNILRFYKKLKINLSTIMLCLFSIKQVFRDLMKRFSLHFFFK